MERNHLLLICLLPFVAGIADPGPGITVAGYNRHPVPYTVHSGYFVSNEFEPNTASSFVVLQNQKEFDRVFGVAAVMFDRSRRLEPNVFSNRIVVAAIHRGHADIKYRVVSVTRNGAVLQIRYTTKTDRTPLTEYACPLILSVPRDGYSAVQFIENKKLIKSVPMR